MARAAASVPDAMPSSTKALRLGDAGVIVLDLVQVMLDVSPSAVRVDVVVIAKPVLEGGVGDVDHEDGKG
eukprot:5682287-Pleurochrysis_carterae.AAC.1